MTALHFIPHGVDLEFLEFVFAGSGDNAEIAWSKLTGKLEIKDLETSAYRLLPLVYWQIDKLKIQTDLEHDLHHIYLKSWETNEIIFSKFRVVKIALQEAQIPFIPLKGYPLAHNYYPDHATRPMGDIDILVKPNDLGRAMSVLEQLGYKEESHIPEILVPGRHAFAFVKDNEFESIDLHSQIIHGGTMHHINDFIWNGASSRDALEYTLSPTDLLFNVLAHGVVLSALPPVRWIPDSLFIISKKPDDLDWTRLTRIANLSRRSVLIAEQLRYLRSQFGAAIPEEAIKELSQQPLSSFERFSYSVISKESRFGLIRNFQALYRSLFFEIQNLPRRNLLSVAAFITGYVFITAGERIRLFFSGKKHGRF